ncbi:unnamed protein product [Brassicogethes aeneus]|uniref:Palmitoleoyl-protein carboxylesterase NOTUM n=1 Tax=Brassicogethes aeneus TaxID=1431903 RepID=A0A9P0FGE7_BRAAE|nr:unnamed protein product [Brassicogethes aeneus]
MRAFAQIFSIWLGVCAAFPNTVNDVSFEQPIYSNTIQRVVQNSETRGHDVRALKKVFLSNRSITCNDGSQSGFYLRKSYTSKKWIIFLEGGWYCYDHHSCRTRWLRQRHYMTSSQWPETRDIGGILSANMEENPFWWNANHVFIPYCTSDIWSGTRIQSTNEMFSFMGSSIVQQAIKDLIPLGLENSTDLLLTGSSAGGTGVMLNLDNVRELLHEEYNLKQINVRGVTDSGWFLDRAPYTHGTALIPAVEASRKGLEYWKGKVPRRCREEYPNDPWKCFFGYRIYPHLKTELFVFQWLFDEAQMNADNVGTPVTKQQWDYIHKMGDALRHSFENVSAVFAPSCISHSVLTKRDWQNVKIDDISIAEALHCWEQKTGKRRLKRLKNNKMFMDQPGSNRKLKNADAGVKINVTADNMEVNKKRKKKHRKNRRGGGKKKKDRFQQESFLNANQTTPITSNTLSSLDKRNQRSVLHSQRRVQGRHCAHRRMERCSWPQCNHSCPRLQNPYTGEEMGFLDLLKSFGLDMDSVANALGIDIDTLNNMDHSELLNLLTQQNS